jgi:hypothetical protein
MKCRLIIAFISILFLVTSIAAQTALPVQNPPVYRSTDAVENISNDVARTARAVESLSRSWVEFTKNFSSNQGLQMEERERKLILALEVLNRFEVSHANMLKLKLDLVERQNRTGRQLATVIDNLLPQSIDRFVALRGTTDAENIREIRRTALSKEHRELTLLTGQINRELYTVENDLLRMEQQIKTLRNQIFGEAARQLADF